jgi:hypothetical protein
MQQFLRLALPLGDRASRALDVRAGTVVIALEKHHARPDVDRVLVFSREVMIETGDEQLFDARGAIGIVRGGIWRAGGIAQWLRHQVRVSCIAPMAIMGHNPRSVNGFTTLHDPVEERRADPLTRA